MVRLCLEFPELEGHICLALAAFVHIKLVSYANMVSISAANVFARNRLPWVLSRFVHTFLCRIQQLKNS